MEFREFVRVMAKKAETAKILEKEEEFRKAFEVERFKRKIYYIYFLSRCSTVTGVGRSPALSSVTFSPRPAG